jgi:hypothetical protein
MDFLSKSKVNPNLNNAYLSLPIGLSWYIFGDFIWGILRW